MTHNKKLPARRYHQTPRPLWSDAYTINSKYFESEEANQYSKYYGTFRHFPEQDNPRNIEPQYEDKTDDRIVFAGLQALCDMLFYYPVTHEEIDETLSFLKGRKVTPPNGGFEDFEFPEKMWRRVVDEFGGWLPLRVTGMSEGSVVYPHEPFVRVEPTAEGFGPLAAWFESTLIQVWSATERVTAARHFVKMMYNIIRNYEPDSVSDEECLFLARTQIHDFGDRAGACPMESELVGKEHNYVFFGTDTFRGAYQNWKNGAPPAFGSSIKALAHRVVQGFENEGDVYWKLYNTANPNELLSMVADCYDYWNALEQYLIPIAKQAQKDNDGRTVVARPDSGLSFEMVHGTLKRAHQEGLMQPYPCKDGEYRAVSTTLRYIVGNGEDYQSVVDLTEELLDEGYVPWRCGIYGMGGHLRNNISRDDLSTKYALCAVGADRRPVVKLSNSPGKQTLPECKVLRSAQSTHGAQTPGSAQALETGVTLVNPDEGGEDAHVVYYDGSKDEPFGSGFTDTFTEIEDRVMNGFARAPKNAGQRSENLQNTVDQLIERYRGDE